MKIKIAIADSRILPEEERKLTLSGYRVLTLPPFSRLSPAVASHADMLIARIGDEYVSYADYCEEASYVFSDLSLLMRGTGARLHFTADEVNAEYPHDVGLNALRMRGKLFCRVSSASPFLLDMAKKSGIEIVDVKQGYPACTVLKLSETAAITSDRGMAAVLTKHGIRVQLISEGDVSLPPHEYGFIGGAAGVFKGTVYFLGDIDTHPSADAVKRAISMAGMNYESLSDEPLLDLGRIVFYEE